MEIEQLRVLLGQYVHQAPFSLRPLLPLCRCGIHRDTLVDRV
jgi:hypothetical protein